MIRTKTLFTSLLIVGACSEQNLSTKTIPIDLSKLDSLEEWQGQSELNDSKSRYILIIHLSDLDCQTCVKRELLALRKYRKRNGHLFQTMTVIYDPSTTITSKNPYLRDLKRVGGLPGPLLLERIPGEAGLGEGFSINLVDYSSNEIVLQYRPKPEDERWPTFEKKLDLILKSKARS